MTIVYGVFGLIWMIFSVMNYKELIRIQFWIGGVIFLGMLEKAVFYSEYSAVNHSGLSLTGAHKFAQAVSALKVEHIIAIELQLNCVLAFIGKNVGNNCFSWFWNYQTEIGSNVTSNRWSWRALFYSCYRRCFCTC